MFGASGGLGNAVVRELAARGKPTRGVDRSGRAVVPQGVELVTGDATDAESARRACRGASVVYHCANARYDQWPRILPPMMEGIIEGAASAGAKLVFGDNLYMYGPVSGPITEDLPYAATGRKGRVRARIATALMEAHQSGKVRATIGRGSDFFGPGVTLSALGDRVFPAALAGKAAQVLGNVDAPHTYTFVRDFARALITLGEREEAPGQVWHVPNAETLTTRQMLEIVYDEAGTALKVQAVSGWLVSVLGLFNAQLRELKEMLYEFEAAFVVDHGKFERAFGAQPTPHREAVRQTLDWYRHQAK